MKQANDFAHDMIDLDVNPHQLLYLAARDVFPVQNADGTISLTIYFQPMRHSGTFMPLEEAELPRKAVQFNLTAYGDEVLRLSGAFADTPIEQDSIMLDLDPSMQKNDLSLTELEVGRFAVNGSDGKMRARISTVNPPMKYWSGLQRPADPMIQIELFPDGDENRPITLMSYDHFFPGKLESVSLGFLTQGNCVTGTLFSLHARPNEHFYGTGERFGRLDLAGKTVTLENTDGLGTASRKAYKNVPFFFSSGGYGLFIHSSAQMRLSFADISNRAVQGLIEEDRLDLFFIGGKKPEPILSNYRRLTGASPDLPLWSYGMWMSRMSYFSATEVRQIADRLREEHFPCDVIHLDTGYFTTDWVCDWKFSPQRFPDPKKFIDDLKKKGFRISVWQTPNIGKENPLYEEAVENGYLPTLQARNDFDTMSDFSGQDFGGQIDFTDPEASEWYKGKLQGLFDLGVACIKTDFGEKIVQNATFKNMPKELLYNLYSLLYQKAAFEATGANSDKPFIWGRSTWAGGQRYPLHWGGDTSTTWDGMAATLRGGLQFGLSGYTFWSHDIPGFHGLPEFMNSWPSETLYLRWTQFGVFTSHMRYHGTSPREPWEYPGCADLVRSWLRMRYALIPYILQEAAFCTNDTITGRPMVAPMLLDYPEDPTVWSIDDQYLFGRDLLVAPIMGDSGLRDVYLPTGTWVDLYSGRMFTGGAWLLEAHYPLAAIPVFVRANTRLPYYPLLVDSTAQMDLEKVRFIQFPPSVGEEVLASAECFTDLASSSLGKLCNLAKEELCVTFKETDR
ncbi:MAG: glycoside hydrolase family 31 protein [Sphaerochaeta sp.]|nr:glycoside hydrolase family 31 protein [Sphaerochaeta sp.]